MEQCPSGQGRPGVCPQMRGCGLGGRRAIRPFERLTTSESHGPAALQLGIDVKAFIQNTPIDRQCFLLAAAESELGPLVKRYLGQRGFRADVVPVNDYVVMQFPRE